MLSAWRLHSDSLQKHDVLDNTEEEGTHSTEVHASTVGADCHCRCHYLALAVGVSPAVH